MQTFISRLGELEFCVMTDLIGVYKPKRAPGGIQAGGRHSLSYACSKQEIVSSSYPRVWQIAKDISAAAFQFEFELGNTR